MYRNRQIRRDMVTMFLAMIIVAVSLLCGSDRRMEASEGGDENIALKICSDMELDEPLVVDKNMASLASGSAVSYMVSAERGQNLQLSHYVSVKNGTKEKREKATISYKLVEGDSVQLQDGGKIKLKKKGVSYIQIFCKLNGKAYDSDVIAVCVEAKKESRAKQRKIYNSIEKLDKIKKISEKNIAPVYNKYFRTKKLIKSYKKFEKASSINHDCKKNFIGITNKWLYNKTADRIEKYISKNQVRISKIRYISEYEGFDIIFNRRINRTDIVSYAYKHQKKYRCGMVPRLRVVTERTNGKNLQSVSISVPRKTKYVHVKLKKSKFDRTVYNIKTTGFAKTISKTSKFYNVYTKCERLYFVKHTIYFRSASLHGSKSRLASPYRSYKCVGYGRNGWCRIRMDNGKIVYARKSSLSGNQPARYRAVSSGDRVYSYEDMKRDISQLQSRYSEIINVSVLTSTPDKNNVYCIRMGNSSASKKIVIQSTMHAREWLNTQMIMQSVEYYCKNYYAGSYKDVSLRKLFRKTCFYILPMVNPDGVNISQFGLDGIKDKKLRKQVKKISKGKDLDSWKANARGVDLNRNFSSGFGGGKHKTKPASQDYPGRKAFSEKETKALVKLIKRVKPVCVINYHEVGEIIYHREESELLDLISEITGYLPARDDEGKNGSLGSWLSSKNIVWCTPETCKGEAPVDHGQYSKLWKKNKDIIAAVALLYSK